jgi:hypothetical protein
MKYFKYSKKQNVNFEFYIIRWWVLYACGSETSAAGRELETVEWGGSGVNGE